MSGILPNGKQQFIDSNGNPLASGKVYYYIPSTTTFKNTYQDPALSILNTNPIQLDANGQCIAYGEGSYRQQVYDVNNNLIWDQESDAPLSFSDFSGSNGASLIGYTQGSANAITETVQTKLRQSIHVKDFGAIGNGSTDDTTAIQNAINYAITNSYELEITNGTYLVTTILIQNANGLIIHGGGSLIGVASGGSYSAVLEIKNTVDLTITGRLAVSASLNTGYAAGIKVWQSRAGASSYHFYENIEISSAQVAWQFGDLSQVDVVLSEITVKGGFTYACPIAVKAIGSETVINFVGTILQSSYGSGTGSWLSLPSAIIYTIGAYVGVTSGEMLLVNAANYVGVKVEPIASLISGNIYGNVYIQGVEFECASQYVVIDNPAALTPIAAVSAETAVRFIGCNGYHSGNFAPLVVVNADYNGSIVFNSNNFYAGPIRTIENIDAASSGNTTCNIYCDAQSFGYNFIQGLDGQAGGICHFDYRQIFEATNTNGQTLTANTPTILAYQSNVYNQDTNRYLANYNFSTGQFTIPPGGLKNVTIVASVQTSVKTSAAFDLAAYVNNTYTQAAATIQGGTYNSGWQRATFALGDLVGGTLIDVRATQYVTSGVTAGGGYESFTIFARN
jgi:hypothetical protein